MRRALAIVAVLVVCGAVIGSATGGAGGKAQVGGTKGPDGREIQIDLAGELHRHNITSQGQGCCVFRSLHHAALWQNVPALEEFAEWVRSKKLTGGGYPENVKQRIKMICQERGVPEPEYIQVQGSDLKILELATKSGRMPAVTYCVSPTGRYGYQRIAHMVNLVHADGEWFAVLDNNHPGADKYEWMPAADFKRTYAGMGGWAVILLSPGPPPPPRNQ